VGTLPGEVLAWPNHDGALIPNPRMALHFLAHPLPASIQWEELYNGSQGLRYAVLDSNELMELCSSQTIGGSFILSLLFFKSVNQRCQLEPRP